MNTFRLEWAREGEACPSGDEITRQVAARLGRNPFDESARRVLRGSVRRSSEEWIVHVDEVVGDRIVDTRDSSVTAPDCEATLATSAFLITRLIETTPEDEAAPRPSDPSIAPANMPVVPPVNVPVAPPVNVPVNVPVAPPVSASPPSFGASPRGSLASRLDATLLLGGGAQFGLLPVASPSIAFAGSVGVDWFEATGGMALLPDSTSADGVFSFGLTTGWLGGCARRTGLLQRVSLVGCLDVFGGQIHGVVHTVSWSKIHPSPSLWLAAALSPKLRVSIAGPLVVEIGAHVMTSLVRRAYSAGPEQVFVQSLVGVVPFAAVGVSIF